MKPPYLIKSTVNRDGHAWGVVRNDTGYTVELFDTLNHDATLQFHFLDDLPQAMRYLGRKVYGAGLLIDWTTYRIPAGIRIAVTREAKGMAQAETTIFETQADYDEYRRTLLADEYVDDLDYEPGEDTVASLLEAGRLGKAWDLAICDVDGDRQLWDTDFGSFDVEEQPVTVAFTDLPSWIQQAARSAVAS
jgi:hypothetical protein